MLMKPAILLYGPSDKNRDMLYSTKYYTSHPFLFVMINDLKYVIVGKSEIPDARKHAVGNEVLSFEDFLSFKDYVTVERRNNSSPSRLGYFSEVASSFLRQRGVKQIFVQPDFPFKMGQVLKWHGFALKVEDSSPFFKQRLVKSEEELKAIKQSIAAAELVLGSVVEMIRKSDIHKDILYHDGLPLTSEALRQFIRLNLYENDFVTHNPIVSCGFDTASPHKEGSGPLKSDQPILIDIFPKSLKSNYFADITRTVVKGRASSDVRKVHDAVLGANELAISMVKEDVKVSSIHAAVHDLFKSRNFNTNEERDFGFVHSLGHGIGLDVHEPPNLSDNDGVLQAGNVITIEPGLYYPTIGGVRIEDVVLVRKNGCEVLTSYPRELEL